MKVIHIVSYILSIGFIIVCVLVGVGSCNKKQVPSSQARIEPQIQERINDNGLYDKTLVQKATFTTTYYNEVIPPNPPSNIVKFIEDNENTWIIATYGVTFGIDIYLEGELSIYSNNAYNDLKFDLIRFVIWHNSDNVNVYKIFCLNNTDNTSYVLYGEEVGWTSQKAVIKARNIHYSNDNLRTYNDNAFDYEAFVGIFFDIYNNENRQFYFDSDNLNPIQYLTYEITDMNLAHNTGSWTAKIDLTNLIFTSNGLIFKGIRFQYDYVLGAYYNGTMETYDNMTYLALSYIAYQEYFTGDWYKVAYPRIYRIETRTLNNTSQLAKYPFTDFSTYLWTNEGFKNIEIINGSNQVWSTLPADPLAYLTYYQILNYEGTLNNVYIEGNNGTNVFVILANGFKSVSSLFAIGILPGITIGTLLFLPLVVVIIFAIIKIIHK